MRHSPERHSTPRASARMAAAATTVARKRGVFYGALRYAVELRRLASHPMDHVHWTAPRSNDEIDRLSVANPDQAQKLLSSVSDRAPRLVAFFACMYYSALRPAEVTAPRNANCPRRAGAFSGSPVRPSTPVSIGATTLRPAWRTGN
jgi:integrase